jgi:LPXTG-site transpeptidase (sortase) family protein
VDLTPSEPPVEDPRPDRRRFLVLAGVGVVVLAGGGAAWLRERPGATPSADAPTTTASPSLQVSGAAAVVLPVPDPLPVDPAAATPEQVVGTIELPTIGISAPIQEGITLTAINRGPAHWPGTAMPGQLGNVVIAGHRTVYTHPFNQLDRLKPGDAVVLTTPSGRFTYGVRGIVIVPGEAIDIAAQSAAHTATLFACHPPGSSRQRIVAKLALLGPDGRPVDPPDQLPPLDAGSQDTDHTLVVAAPDPLSGSGG